MTDQNKSDHYSENYILKLLPDNIICPHCYEDIPKSKILDHVNFTHDENFYDIAEFYYRMKNIGWL